MLTAAPAVEVTVYPGASSIATSALAASAEPLALAVPERNFRVPVVYIPHSLPVAVILPSMAREPFLTYIPYLAACESTVPMPPTVRSSPSQYMAASLLL